MTPIGLAWIEITCNDGDWLAEDGLSSTGLFEGSDLILALQSAHPRSKPAPSQKLLVQVETMANGWTLRWATSGTAITKVVRDASTAERVLDHLRRTQASLEGVFSRIEAFAYAGDEKDKFSIPLVDKTITRGQVQAGIRVAHGLVRLGQLISLMPQDGDGT